MLLGRPFPRPLLRPRSQLPPGHRTARLVFPDTICIQGQWSTGLSIDGPTKKAYLAQLMGSSPRPNNCDHCPRVSEQEKRLNNPCNIELIPGSPSTELLADLVQVPRVYAMEIHPAVVPGVFVEVRVDRRAVGAGERLRDCGRRRNGDTDAELPICRASPRDDC